MMQHLRSIVLAATMAALAACSAGGDNTMRSVQTFDTARVPVTVSVTVPRRPATHRSPSFISPATQSAVFTAVTDPTTSQTVTAVCTNACSATFLLYPGPVGLNVVLYGTPGEVLGAGHTTTEVVAGAAAPVTIVVEPNIVSAALASSATVVHIGQPQSLTITAATTDAAGTTITGSDPYTVPVTLGLSGAGTAAFTLQPTTLLNAAATATLAYGGGGSAGQTVTLQPGIAQPFAATLTPVTITIAP